MINFIIIIEINVKRTQVNVKSLVLINAQWSSQWVSRRHGFHTAMLDLKMRKKRVTVPLGSDGLLHRVLKKKKKNGQKKGGFIWSTSAQRVFLFSTFIRLGKKIFFINYILWDRRQELTVWPRTDLWLNIISRFQVPNFIRSKWGENWSCW